MREKFQIEEKIKVREICVGKFLETKIIFIIKNMLKKKVVVERLLSKLKNRKKERLPLHAEAIALPC